MLPELLIMLGISGIGKGINAASEKRSFDDWGVYEDGNGELRIKPSLRKVYFGRTPEGEDVIYYFKGGIAKNIGIEIAKRNEIEAKSNGDKFYMRAPAGGSYMKKMGNDDISGERYCKVDEPNDIYYVKRFVMLGNTNESRWCHGEFYMDMNYNLVSPSESCIKKELTIFGNIDHENHQKIIDTFNSKPKEIRKEISAHENTFTIY